MLSTIHEARTREMLQLERRFKVVEMYTRGTTQAMIAHKLGVSQPTVARDVAAMRKEWRDSCLTNLEEYKVDQLQKIDKLEEELWAAWERSKLDYEAVRTRTQTKGQRDRNGNIIPIKTSAEKYTFRQVGDGQWTEQIRKCVELRCRILGLIAKEPIKHVQNMLDWDSMLQLPQGVNGNGASSVTEVDVTSMKEATNDDTIDMTVGVTEVQSDELGEKLVP